MRQFSLTEREGSTVTDELRPVPRTDVFPGLVDGHLVLFDRVAELSHILNPSATLIWSLVDGESDVRSIVDEVARHARVDREQIEPDVKGTIGGLLESGVITVDGPSGGPTNKAAGPEEIDESEIGEARAQAPLLGDLPWSFGPFRAGGTNVVVGTNDAATADAVGEAFSLLPATGSGASLGTATDSGAPAEGESTTVVAFDAGADAPRRHRVFVDQRRTWWSSDREIFASQVVAEINEAVVDGSVGLIRMHAGAVERDGEVVVIAGASGSGKSTLTAALVQQGWRYVTDEVVTLVPEDLRVLPFAKAFDLGPRSLEMLGLEQRDTQPRPSGSAKSRVPVHLLGEPSTGGTLGLVVLLDPADAGSDDMMPAPAAAQLLVSIISTTFAVSIDRQSAMDALVMIAATVPVVRLERTPLNVACDLVETEFAKRST